jgi:hypothetical protein
MTFSVILFILSWSVYFIVADKNKYVYISPTSYIAVILALVTDLLMFVYPLWEYPSGTNLALFIKQLLNSFGIYFVVTYLFIQYLPKDKSHLQFLLYIFYWTGLSIFIEFVSLKVGYITHSYWWNLGWSYLSDWLLFLLFYYHFMWRISNLNGKTE